MLPHERDMVTMDLVPLTTSCHVDAGRVAVRQSIVRDCIDQPSINAEQVTWRIGAYTAPAPPRIGEAWSEIGPVAGSRSVTVIDCAASAFGHENTVPALVTDGSKVRGHGGVGCISNNGAGRDRYPGRIVCPKPAPHMAEQAVRYRNCTTARASVHLDRGVRYGRGCGVTSQDIEVAQPRVKNGIVTNHDQQRARPNNRARTNNHPLARVRPESAQGYPVGDRHGRVAVAVRNWPSIRAASARCVSVEDDLADATLAA